MFHDIPVSMLDRMRALEAMHEADKTDGTPRFDRLRQISPDTGKFLAILAAQVPEGSWVEVGTSAGYSALWLSLAARPRGARLTTYEISPRKQALARETFALTGVSDVVDMACEDAVPLLSTHEGLAFVFLDAERSILMDCYAAVIPAPGSRRAPGGGQRHQPRPRDGRIPGLCAHGHAVWTASSCPSARASWSAGGRRKPPERPGEPRRG